MEGLTCPIQVGVLPSEETLNIFIRGEESMDALSRPNPFTVFNPSSATRNMLEARHICHIECNVSTRRMVIA